MVRLQVELDEDTITEIEALMKEGNAQTMRDFLNAALTLFRWAINERKAGRIIASVDETKNSYGELIMPILSDVKPVN